MKGSKSHVNRRMFRGTGGYQDEYFPTVMPRRPQAAQLSDSPACLDEGGNRPEPSRMEDGSDEPLDVSRDIEVQVLTDGSTLLQKNMKDPQEAMDSNIDDAFLEEIRALKRKIRNIQESIQLSTNIAQPIVWKENGLNAAFNAVKQWRNITSFYSARIYDLNSNIGLNDEFQHGREENRPINKAKPDSFINHSNSCSFQTSNSPIHPDSQWSKDTALEVYGLMQFMMQSGPLKGSSPGYFKRCGGEVAKMAKEFLLQCILCENDKERHTIKSNADALDTRSNVATDDSFSEDLRFTAKQKEAIQKWIRDADRKSVV